MKKMTNTIHDVVTAPETFTSSMNLRFAWRTASREKGLLTRRERVLQQAAIGNQGSVKWIDIPVVDLDDPSMQWTQNP